MIFFLNDMVEEGVLKCEERSGKGGYHRVYYPKMSREQFARYVVETITDKLYEVFHKD
ncbi:MAG: hypothetical protein ACETV0_03605 [Nitrososphaeria archaeon]